MQNFEKVELTPDQRICQLNNEIQKLRIETEQLASARWSIHQSWEKAIHRLGKSIGNETALWNALREMMELALRMDGFANHKSNCAIYKLNPAFTCDCEFLDLKNDFKIKMDRLDKLVEKTKKS